jgi:hypothetical protein
MVRAMTPHRALTIVDILPTEVIRRIVSDDLRPLLKYELRKWVPIEKIDKKGISINPNALDFLSQNKKYIDYAILSKNTHPKAIELLRAEIAVNPENIDWRALSANPSAIDLLDENRSRIRLAALSGNTDPRAIQLLIERRLELTDGFGTDGTDGTDGSPDYEDGIDWDALSGNISNEAIAFLSLPQNYNKINWDTLSGNTNPNAIRLLTTKYDEEFALEDHIFKRLLLEPTKVLNWFKLSKNIEAISLLERKWAEEKELLSYDYEDKNGVLKRHRKRYDLPQYNYLKSKGYIVAWTAVSLNVKAIDLLRRKIEEEGMLSAKAYESLEPIEKISWWVLSANPKAIQLLQANRDKINWVQLGKNPKAIKILEDELKVRPQNIWWYSLSENIEATHILDKNRDKIVWSVFSKNTNAGELLKDKAIADNKIPRRQAENMDPRRIIDWHDFFANPSIFTIV